MEDESLRREAGGGSGRLGSVVLLACMLALVFASPAAAQRYRSKRAGHPLRIVAYALHPVGVILDRLIFHPAWVVAQYEPIRTLVGMEHVPVSDAAPGVVTNPFLEPYSEEP